MGDTQFLVHWEEHPTHLATRLGYLLEHQSLVDVTLMCNTHTLKVHRAVLAACSPYFERQLGNHPLIVLKDMKFSVLKSLVEFMYCGETSVSEENLTALLEAAKFFEVKGLAAMTKESVCNSTSPTTKTVNGTATPNTVYNANRGANRGRGRGRGRPPLTTTKVGSPTESAQILLSLSGNSHSPQLYTTSKNVKIDPNVMQNSLVATSVNDKSKLGTFEPRRRGRRRGALNAAFRDKLIRDTDTTQLAIDSLKKDMVDDADHSSPLLSSLLHKPDPKTSKSDEESNLKYLQTLKEIGLPTNVPILFDGGDGRLVRLTEELLKSVIETDGNLQFHLTEGDNLESGIGILSHVSNSTFAKKEVDGISDSEASSDALTNKAAARHFNNIPSSSTAEGFMKLSNSKLGPSKLGKNDNDNVAEDLITKSVIESLKSGVASEAESDPEAVVLYEVTGNKKVEKYVLSAKEVNTLKALNEQLTKQKKQLADITKNNVSTIDVVGTTKIAELKLKIGKTKSILSQIIERAQGARHLDNSLSKPSTSSDPLSKKPQSQVVQLEFIDGNGEKIEGYQVEGTVFEKRIGGSSRESDSAKENDLMGLFDMVCPNNEESFEDDSDLKKNNEHKSQPMLSNDSTLLESSDSKDMSYQLVMNNHLEDQHEENMSYAQIEAMIGDAGDNIVIEHKNQDLKYIIGNDGTIMNQDANYVVYDSEKPEISSEYVIYDEGESVLPDITSDDNPGNYVVGEGAEVIQHEDGTEYIVYGEDKSDLRTELKIGDSEGTQYIVYTSDENEHDKELEYQLSKSGVVVKDGEDEFIYSKSQDSILGGEMSNDGEGGSVSVPNSSTSKDVPSAVGLVPLKDALEKFQSISEHAPRRTRSNSSSSSTHPGSIGNRRRSSTNSDLSDKPDKKLKMDPMLADHSNSDSL